MHWRIALAAALVVVMASAEDAPNKQGAQTHHANPPQQQQSPTLDTSALERTIREAVKETGEREKEHAAEKLDTDRKISEYTRQLADYTKELSGWTMWLSIVTFGLGVITLFQFFVSKNAAEAIPKIERAYVFPRCSGSVGSSGATMKDGQTIRTVNLRFDIELYNHGRTPAVLVALRCWATLFEVTYRPTSIGEPTYKGGAVLPSKPEEARDEMMQIPVDQDAFQRAKAEGVPAIFHGEIVYIDMLGKRRTTSFTREFNLANESLYLPDDGSAHRWD